MMIFYMLIGAVFLQRLSAQLQAIKMALGPHLEVPDRAFNFFVISCYKSNQ
jgi:hypothetical protein